MDIGFKFNVESVTLINPLCPNTDKRPSIATSTGNINGAPSIRIRNFFPLKFCRARDLASGQPIATDKKAEQAACNIVNLSVAQFELDIINFWSAVSIRTTSGPKITKPKKSVAVTEIRRDAILLPQTF